MLEPTTATVLGYKPGMLLFAIIGSAISLQFVKALNWWQGIVTFTSGSMVAIVAVPGLVDYKNWNMSNNTENALSFFTAMFSMAIIAMLFAAIGKLDLAGKISKFIDKRLGL